MIYENGNPGKAVYVLLVFLAGVSGPVFGWSGEPQRERPPNVVLILADDLGYADLSCYGGSVVSTPRCDRLAETGLRFTDMHAPASVCTPSRYGILTGRYSWRTWLKDWVVNGRMPLLIEEDRYTLQRMFAEHGYATACIGKWHLGWGRRPYAYQEGRLQPGPLETGFDYFFGLPYSHNAPMPEMNVYVRNREIVGLRDSEDIMDPEVQARLARDLDETAGRLSSEAVRWIETHGDQPFFLYYPVANVHYPLTPGPRFKGKSGAGDYFDFVLEFDWIVGEIKDTLDRLGIADNTILIVTSDNGSRRAGSNDPWRGIKGEVYEGGHRIPFILNWPEGIQEPATVNQLVSHTDLFATFADILGVALPPASGEDSLSFRPLLKDPDRREPTRNSMVHHSVTGMFAFRSGPWKWIDGVGGGRSHIPGDRSVPFEIFLYADEAVPEVDPHTGTIEPWSFQPHIPEPGPDQAPGQLYHLGEDPKETRNRWREESRRIELMKRKLDQRRHLGQGDRELDKDFLQN